MGDNNNNIENKTLVDAVWTDMSKTLDIEMPQKKKRNFFLLVAMYIGLIGFGYFTIDQFMLNNDSTTSLNKRRT